MPAHEPTARAGSRGRRVASRFVLSAIVLGLGGGPLMPSPAEAFATLVSQDRRVRTSYSGSVQTSPGVSQPVSGQNEMIAPDFGDFVATVPGFDAEATQISSITPERMGGGGSMSAEGVLELGPGTGFSVSATARSQFSATFEVHTPTSFVLDGTLDAEAIGSGTPLEARIQLLLDGATVVAEIPCVETSPAPVRRCTATSAPVEGVLEPGLYTLEAVVESTGTPTFLGMPPPKYGSGAYTVGLSLESPEPAPALGAGSHLVLAAILTAAGARVAMGRSLRKRHGIAG